jgi:methionyl-tRNA formyltransferase
MTGSPAEAGVAEPARTVFFGSGAFAVPMLDALLELPAVHVVAAVSVPDRPAGRGRLLTASPLATHAVARNIPLLQPASLRDPAVADRLTALRPTLAVLADYGGIVPPPVLDLPVHGFLNVHPSRLPRHRGATPIPATIIGGDADAGVTIIRMDAGVDTGPIIASEAFPLTGDETARVLEAQAAAVGAALLARTVPAWLAGALEARAQPDGATLTKPLGREDGRLDGTEPAAIAARRIRALDPWPGTFIEAGLPPLRLAVLRGEAASAGPGDVPGRIVADGRGVALSTADGRLRLLEIRPAGGKPMSGEEWRRGRAALIGAIAVPKVGGTSA